MMNAYDENGCCVSCGYSWCDILEKCIRIWETECTSHRQLNKLDQFNLTELAVFIASVFASLSAFMVVLFRSKCEEINCCCWKCKRRVDLVIAEEKLQMTGESGLTPRLSLQEENKKAKKEQLEETEEPESEKNI